MEDLEATPTKKTKGGEDLNVTQRRPREAKGERECNILVGVVSAIRCS